MLTKNGIGNLINKYKAVLKKCHLINTFGSLAGVTAGSLVVEDLAESGSNAGNLDLVGTLTLTGMRGVNADGIAIPGTSPSIVGAEQITLERTAVTGGVSILNLASYGELQSKDNPSVVGAGLVTSDFSEIFVQAGAFWRSDHDITVQNCTLSTAKAAMLSLPKVLEQVPPLQAAHGRAITLVSALPYLTERQLLMPPEILW